jgi:hypothetical protein
LLKAGVIITAYNPHVGSFFRALGLQKQPKFTRLIEPTSSWNQQPSASALERAEYRDI